eukprot:gnl/TRDRNA2_/TRDRNA2_63753_c1_seq1.p1 gnl/TRDRNA2_/TRDRNA2_63753_c1~~gnl/TRDRNA2_/TRDRNA2_63753_c1_seq1.p1  ORF type:complete len:355 (+),score=55.91 gnl/TRDRNA2_/TRDRNA2_63753_c1_seq1:108-1067(+)
MGGTTNAGAGGLTASDTPNTKRQFRPFEAAGRSLLTHSTAQGSTVPPLQLGCGLGLPPEPPSMTAEMEEKEDLFDSQWRSQVRASMKTQSHLTLAHREFSNCATNVASTGSTGSSKRPPGSLISGDFVKTRTPRLGEGDNAASRLRSPLLGVADDLCQPPKNPPFLGLDQMRSTGGIEPAAGDVGRTSAEMAPGSRHLFQGIGDQLSTDQRGAGLYGSQQEQQATRQYTSVAGAKALEKAKADAKARANACFEDLIAFLEMHQLSGAYALAFAAHGIEDLSQLLLMDDASIDNLLANSDMEAMDEILLRGALRDAAAGR